MLPHYGVLENPLRLLTKWNIYEQNLLSEYHIRYGGYGGIGYYHVSDKYITLFSHFKAFNDFVQRLFFGGDGIIAENIRHEQRKVIKYNHLVATCHFK